MKKYLYLIFLLVITTACSSNNRRYIESLLEKWVGKEILFPKLEAVNTKLRIINLPDYKIVTYVDSVGCMSCKFNLRKWRQFIQNVDTLKNVKVAFLFYLQVQRSQRMKYILKWDKFHSPVYLDESDSFDKLNDLPHNESFHTFLLNGNNKVLAIGNPIHNPKVKELYLKIIRGDALSKNKKKEVITMVSLDKSMFSMGTFGWEKEQNTTFLLKNIGDKAFVVNDVTTSCGCTSVEYSKEPIRPGKSLALHVTYKADHPGHFDKTVSVYCNVPSSPIQLRINGNAN